MLRRREGSEAVRGSSVPPAAFRAPCGDVIALAGVAASWTLVTRMTSTELVWLGGVSVLALLH